MLPANPGTSRLVIGAPRLLAGAPSYFESWQECPPRVWYSPEIDASKCILHILSDTPGGFEWLKYIVLMFSLNQCLRYWLTQGVHVTGPSYGACVTPAQVSIAKLYQLKLPLVRLLVGHLSIESVNFRSAFIRSMHLNLIDSGFEDAAILPDWMKLAFANSVDFTQIQFQILVGDIVCSYRATARHAD
jgi:hypothetical protein